MNKFQQETVPWSEQRAVAAFRVMAVPHLLLVLMQLPLIWSPVPVMSKTTVSQNLHAWQCSKGSFHCSDGRCIPQTWLCDGDQDCVQAEDEKNCNSNEYEKPSACSQICIKRHGSYECKCLSGCVLEMYQLEMYLCGDHAKLLVSNHDGIEAVDVVTKSATPLLTGLGVVVAFDYDHKSRRIFWSVDKDTETKILSCTFDEDMSSLSNGCMQAVVSANLSSVHGLAIDWVRELLYWTDMELHTISVVRFDGQHRRTLFDTNLHRPRAIAVDPLRGVMFWADHGRYPKIERAGLDGTHRQVIMDRGIGSPNDIVLELDEQRVYWTDSTFMKIYNADYFGNNRMVVASYKGAMLYPFGVALFETKIYWSDWRRQKVIEANRIVGGMRDTWFSSDPADYMNLCVAHEVTQPEIPNSCSADPCSQLCVAAFNLANDFTLMFRRQNGPYPYCCLCADGFHLGNDGRSCIAKPNSSRLSLYGGTDPNDQSEPPTEWLIFIIVPAILFIIGVCVSLFGFVVSRKPRNFLPANFKCCTSLYHHNDDSEDGHILRLITNDDDDLHDDFAVCQLAVDGRSSGTAWPRPVSTFQAMAKNRVMIGDF